MCMQKGDILAEEGEFAMPCRAENPGKQKQRPLRQLSRVEAEVEVMPPLRMQTSLEWRSKVGEDNRHGGRRPTERARAPETCCASKKQKIVVVPSESSEGEDSDGECSEDVTEREQDWR